MAQLTETGRKHVARKNFGYIDKESGEHLPVHDAERVRTKGGMSGGKKAVARRKR